MIDFRVVTNLYRCKLAGLPYTLTMDEWEVTCKHFNYRCAYCGGPYEVLEHFVPLSWGGGTVYGNCVPACAPCNTRKDHPKFMLCRERQDTIEVLFKVYTYLSKLDTFDAARADAYLDFQRVKIPVHHNGKSHLYP